VPRLLSGQGTIVACGSLAYPVEWAHAPQEQIKALGVSKVMTMTSTYDHRVIQGAESGSFLRRIEELLQGEDDFYELVATDLGLEPSVVTRAQPPPRRPPQSPTVGRCGRLEAGPTSQAVRRRPPAEGYRPGHLAAVWTRWLEPRGIRRSAREPQPTPEPMSQIPAEILESGSRRPCSGAARMRGPTADDRVPDRAPLSHQQRMWLREMIETGWHRKPLDPEEKQQLLERLIKVFGFERFIEKAYLGQKMFSIEGLDAVVPMLDELFEMAHTEGARDVVIGMAHRGRLSVLAHNLGRSVESILAEFEGAKAIEAVKAVAAIPTGGTGDVKYHYGHQGLYATRDGSEIDVRLYPNPSHLGFVDPVVTGATRAADQPRGGQPRRTPPPRCRCCCTETPPSRRRAWSPRP
jgi:2-oxoglutarate dehydrogenase E1 component